MVASWCLYCENVMEYWCWYFLGTFLTSSPYSSSCWDKHMVSRHHSSHPTSLSTAWTFLSANATFLLDSSVQCKQNIVLYSCVTTVFIPTTCNNCGITNLLLYLLVVCWIPELQGLLVGTWRCPHTLLNALTKTWLRWCADSNCEGAVVS